MELNLFMYKYVNKSLPKIFSNYFILNNEVHSYNTRNAGNIRVIRFETMLGHHSFHYNAIKVWNETGNKIYMENKDISFNCFRKKVKDFILKQM
jgi:hypothetical protein